MYKNYEISKIQELKIGSIDLPILKSNSLLTSTASLIFLFGGPKLVIALCTEGLVISDNIALEKIILN